MHSTQEQEYSKLWLAFINGDQASFSILYKQVYRKLYSYGISLGMADEEIRDIIQEIFIKLYSRPNLSENITSIQAFLFTSIRNAFFNLEKTKKRFTAITTLEHFDIRYTFENTSIEDKEDQERIKSQIKNILDKLTPRQKEIIYLRFLHQMEYTEIAKILGISEQAARNLAYRAIDKARKEYKDPILTIIIFYCISIH